MQVAVIDRKLVDLDIVCGEFVHYSPLELGHLALADRVALGYDGYYVALAVESLHRAEVDGLERVARRTDEVEAEVDARVVALAHLSPQRQLVLQVLLVLLVQIGEDLRVAVGLGQLVAVAARLDQRQLEAHVLLAQLERVRVERDAFAQVVARLCAKRTIEQRLHQRALANTRFAYIPIQTTNPMCINSKK